MAKKNKSSSTAMTSNTISMASAESNSHDKRVKPVCINTIKEISVSYLSAEVKYGLKKQLNKKVSG